MDRTFRTENVTINDGYLCLTTPGGQHGRPSISCAEVTVDFPALHGSMRTCAILSGVQGVCNGLFMYHSDTQETDIEWIGSSVSEKNDCGLLHFVNQGVVEGASSTHATTPASRDATTTVHEYRIDWTPEATTFYVDGVQQAWLPTNVPTKAGRWMWNCWTNGNPHWSGGPPVTDAVLKIQKIVIDYDDMIMEGTGDG